MALTLQNLVKRINKAAPAYAVGKLQQLRAEFHGKQRATDKLFSPQTTFPPWYAFHHGGRKELQFNTGLEERDRGRWWRHGVAFSIEPGQTLPDPVGTLSPKIARFNEWIRENARNVLRFKMWHFDGTEPSRDYRPKEIPQDLVRRGVFIFLGARVSEADVDIDQILRDFDALFPLYEYVESLTQGVPASASIPSEEAESTDPRGDDPYRPQQGGEREVIEREIRARRGQQSFRNALRRRYGDRCVVTGCEILDLLEAAHIKPFRSENDNHSENGLLLRTDIHTAFDLNLLGIEPESLRIEVAPELAKDEVYRIFGGKALRCPSDRRPSKTALKLRYEQFRRRGRRN